MGYRCWNFYSDFLVLISSSVSGIEKTFYELQRDLKIILTTVQYIDIGIVFSHNSINVQTHHSFREGYDT